MRARSLFALLLALGLWSASAARAAPTADDTSKKAREAFTEGTTAFSLGNWESAITAWQRGYQLRPDAIFLYNIAQAYRLADNPEKALFFYRSFLHNAPKAPNREEVEQRIDQLQKLLEARRNAREAVPDAALTPHTTAAPPPPVESSPPGETAVVARPAPPPPSRRIDLGASGGVNLWANGAVGLAPAAGVAITGGYTVLVTQRLELRVGAKLAYSYLSDVGSTDHFISALADPMLRIRLWREKLYFTAEVGLGAMILAGLSRGSSMLVTNALPTGAFASFELRPAIGVEYRITPMVAVFLAPALIYSPAPDPLFLHATLLRIDVSAGVSLRL